MSDNTSNNKRIASNTIMLYFRMFVSLLVGLYTSRVILSTLGMSDYGLYNVVGGVVSMFGFMNSALSTGTLRYLNFELGTGNASRLKLVFSTALRQHLILICLLLFLAETVGLWFVLNRLNIPAGREVAALCCYQFSIITACVSIFQLPFMSAIIAHERMGIYAYISIFDVVMKLLIVYLIQIAPFDHLIFYALLLLSVSITDAIIYDVYGHRHFEEVRLSIKTEKGLFKEMIGFSGWNLIGCFAATCNNSGVNILFNLFFGTVTNAARAISFQINALVTQFYSNFQTAVKPQIVKYYAGGEQREMEILIMNSSKYSALLMAALSIPVAIEIEFILDVWLVQYPERTINFLRLVFIQSVFQSITSPVVMGAHATGYLKMIGICAGGTNLLLLPIIYVLLLLGCPPEAAFVVLILGVISETSIELYWLHHYIRFPYKEFIRKVYVSVLGLVSIMLIIPSAVHLYFPPDHTIVRFFTVCIVSGLTSSVVLYRWGLSPAMRTQVTERVRKIIRR